MSGDIAITELIGGKIAVLHWSCL